MSREIKADFEKLKEFFNTYELPELNENKQLLAILSQQHKKHYSILAFLSELVKLRETVEEEPISQLQIDFLLESASDIGNSMFMMMHGAYKPARMMLRSSIENFLKAISLDTEQDINQEKSVYKIFDRVKALDFFQKDPMKEIFTQIHQTYKELCSDTHTASEINMAHITAMKYFPGYDSKEATTTNDVTIKLASHFLVLICLKFNSIFHVMHHRNKENILISIPKEHRPKIQGIQ